MKNTNTLLKLLALMATFWLFFLLKDAQLFDNDYDVWLPRAWERGWLEVIWQVMRPWTVQLSFGYRPLEALCFKVLWVLFGWKAWGYALFKGLAGLALVLVTFQVASRQRLSPTWSFIAALWVLSSPCVFSSLLWIGDFGVMIPLLGISTLFCLEKYLLFDVKSSHKALIWAAFIVFLILLSTRVKASGLFLAPVVILTSFLVKPSRWKYHLVLGVLLLVCLFPWQQAERLPFFDLGSRPEKGYNWRAVNLDSMAGLLGPVDLQGFQTPWKYPPAGLATSLFPFGLLFISIVLVILLKERHNISLPKQNLWLVAITIWIVCEIAGFSAYPQLPPLFMGRYLVTLTPLVALIAVKLASVTVETLKTEQWRWRLRKFLLVLLVGQVVTGAWGSIQVQRIMGRSIIGWNQARVAVHERFEEALVITFGFAVTSWRPGEHRNEWREWRGKAFPDSFANEQRIVLLVTRDGVLSHPNYVLWRRFTGETGSLFDRLFPAEPKRGYFVYILRR